MNCEYQDLILVENQDALAVKQCKNVESVVIPKEVDGKVVTAIYDWAFAGSTKLKSVVIPDTITMIYGSAFAGCMSLEKIIIPKTVESMGRAVFAGCEKLEIFAEAQNQPENWRDFWNSWERPVYWYSEKKPEREGNFWHYKDGAPEIW